MQRTGTLLTAIFSIHPRELVLFLRKIQIFCINCIFRTLQQGGERHIDCGTHFSCIGRLFTCKLLNRVFLIMAEIHPKIHKGIAQIQALTVYHNHMVSQHGAGGD